MKTFFNILQTIINVKHKHYPDEPFSYLNETIGINYYGDNSHIIFLMNNIFYNEKLCKQTSQFSKSAMAKFMSLNSILENTFYDDVLKETILDIFTKAQKHYNAFSRLVHIYRLKHNSCIVKDDLSMNRLDPKNKNTFILIENKSTYLFNINELTTIIENAIENSPNFFTDPLWPLNPYNNQPFTIATLYNVYFQIKNNGRIMPLTFHCFFLENFNKRSFAEENETLIRKNAIKKYIFNSPYTVLYHSVISMLKYNIYTRNLIIHKHFPKQLLVDIFRPFLFYDYIANYFIKGTSQMYNFKKILNHKLRKFYEYNNHFGRITIKLTKTNNKIVKKEHIVNSDHIPFNKIPVSISPNSNNVSLDLLINALNVSNNDETHDDETDDDETDDDETDDDDENSYHSGYTSW
jgi:hypothetical protein